MQVYSQNLCDFSGIESSLRRLLCQLLGIKDCLVFDGRKTNLTAPVCLIERLDRDNALECVGINGPIPSLSFEAVTYDSEAKAFTAYYLTNNEHCITIVFPDAVWLRPAWKQRLTAHL